ncbi:MAG: hypothetical protein KDN19_23735, partial [Verrucomicrobiae bacterium]|nr:hypothetical protein [Verrucomicrobiae bacterium]
MIVAMKPGWSFVTGLAALGAGFGAGNWHAIHPGEEESSAAASPGAVTFLGDESSSSKGNQTIHPATGTFSYTAFEEARPRLNQLIEKYRDFGPMRRILSPVESERVLQEIEGILALANQTQLAEWIQGIEPSSADDPLFDIAFAALANRSPSVAAQIGREFWNDEEATSFPGLNGMIREWEKRDSPGAERWIESLNEGKLKTSAKQIFLTVKALTDPERAATRLGEIDPNAGYSFASVLGESIDLARCPEMAEQLLQKRSEGSSSPGMIAPFLDSWGKRDPDAMKEWLFSQDLDAIGPDVVQQSLASLSIDDPKALIEEISPRLGVQPALRKAASEAWWGWIATDGEETSAIAWLRENSALAPEFGERRAIYRLSDSSNWSPERTSRVLAALKTLPQDDSLAAFTQDFLGKISEYQPKLVLDFAIDSLPLGSRSDQTVSRAVGKWAETEPEAAIQWSLEH